MRGHTEEWLRQVFRSSFDTLCRSGWLKFPRERGQLSILPMWPILPIWCWSKEKNVLWTSRGGRWVGWEWGKNSLVTCAKLARGEEGHTYTHLGLLTSFIIHSQLRRHPPISEDKKFQENVKLTSGCSDTAVCHFFEAEDFNLLKLNLHSFAESQTASALKVFFFKEQHRDSENPAASNFSIDFSPVAFRVRSSSLIHLYQIAIQSNFSTLPIFLNFFTCLQLSSYFFNFLHISLTFFIFLQLSSYILNFLNISSTFFIFPQLS